LTVGEPAHDNTAFMFSPKVISTALISTTRVPLISNLSASSSTLDFFNKEDSYAGIRTEALGSIPGELQPKFK